MMNTTAIIAACAVKLLTQINKNTVVLNPWMRKGDRQPATGRRQFQLNSLPALAKVARGPHMAHMRQANPTGALLRTAVAVMFGFMSLWHGPIMSFAKANPDAAHQVTSADGHATHHHHSTAHDQQSAPSTPNAVPVCYALGCFVALESLAFHSPVAALIPIGTLSLAPTHAMAPADPDPADPPPRLRV